MQLRDNNVLKYLALLLFSLELLTPSFFQGGQSAEVRVKQDRFLQIQKQSSQQLFLFTEENEENEEWEADQKVPTLFFRQAFVLPFLKIVPQAPSTLDFITQASNFETQPPLYTLHCLLLI